MSKELSHEDFKSMVRLLHRYVNNHMDQWEAWRLPSDFGEIYVHITMKPEGPVSAYEDLKELVE